ncbi:MAG: hypothetical protein V3U11_13360 [Planctomycetota bacterium]
MLLGAVGLLGSVAVLLVTLSACTGELGDPDRYFTSFSGKTRQPETGRFLRRIVAPSKCCLSKSNYPARRQAWGWRAAPRPRSYLPTPTFRQLVPGLAPASRSGLPQAVSWRKPSHEDATPAILS